MELDGDVSSDFLDLLEIVEREEFATPAVKVEEKENFLISGIKRVAKQLSIREFFKGPKRKLVAEEHESDEDNVEDKFKESKTKQVILTGKSAVTKVTSSKFPLTTTAKPVKKVPSFKWIPDSKFVVDAFNYGLIAGAEAYFLTHFHSDHYQGLNGRFWQAAPDQLRMFCSPVTASLVKKELRVPEERIVQLEVGLLYACGDDWKVGVLDANHCPGSVMLVFWDRSRGRWHLHTGDFRFHPGLLEGASLKDAQDGTCYAVAEVLFDHVFLDTTYARPDYAFPSQDEVIAACVSGCQALLAAKKPTMKWCIAVGSYLIGKERIILALAEFFDCKIYADTRKLGILSALQWPELTRRLTDDPCCTPFHIVSMALLSKQKLNDYRASFKGRFTHILGIRPTGWSFSSNSASSSNNSTTPPIPKIDSLATLWSLPYSEHSSYAELAQFLQRVTFRRVVPTVDNWKDVAHDVAKCNYNTDLLLKIISNK